MLSEPSYWITSVKSNVYGKPNDRIINTVMKGFYRFKDSTNHKCSLKPGDQICFYSNMIGVVADATVASVPELKVGNDELSKAYPWYFTLKDIHSYFESPVWFDVKLKSSLDAFKTVNPTQPHGWFVITTRKISKHDFELLTKH